MSKEYLEALEVLCGELVEMDLLFTDRNGENQNKWLKSEAFAKLKEFDKKYGSPVTVLQNALNRLEAIDNANPSEALKCLEKLELLTCDFEWYKDNINTIKQALLKVQEPKHYLKWEDLEFKEEEQTMKVRMGDRNYTLIYHKWFMLGKWYYGVELRNEETLDIIDHIRGKLFNDLHLESVEE